MTCYTLADSGMYFAAQGNKPGFINGQTASLRNFRHIWTHKNFTFAIFLDIQM